jgi:hypothetical protein
VRCSLHDRQGLRDTHECAEPEWSTTDVEIWVTLTEFDTERIGEHREQDDGATLGFVPECSLDPRSPHEVWV